MNQLSGIMKLLNVDYFENVMTRNSFKKEESKIAELESGKQFYICVHSK